VNLTTPAQARDQLRRAKVGKFGVDVTVPCPGSYSAPVASRVKRSLVRRRFSDPDERDCHVVGSPFAAGSSRDAGKYERHSTFVAKLIFPRFVMSWVEIQFESPGPAGRRRRSPEGLGAEIDYLGVFVSIPNFQLPTPKQSHSREPGEIRSRQVRLGRLQPRCRERLILGVGCWELISDKETRSC
jgi:hypothetical protein